MSAEADGMLRYYQVIRDPQAHRDDPNWPLPSFDARDWAEAFSETAKRLYRVEMDEGWLIGWFANALMRGYDEAGIKR